MDETRETFREDWTGLERENSWIMRSPFGPISVVLIPPEDSRHGFTLFCQVLLFPSNYPNGIKPWYQFDHWKQNLHLPTQQDDEAVLEALQRHVMKFHSTSSGSPDERELFFQMLTLACKRWSRASSILRYFQNYYGKPKTVAPGTAREPALEPV